MKKFSLIYLTLSLIQFELLALDAALYHLPRKPAKGLS